MLKKTGNGNFVWKGNMQVRELLKALIIAERVKDTTRHHKNFKLMKRRYIMINSKKLNRVAVIISLSILLTFMTACNKEKVETRTDIAVPEKATTVTQNKAESTKTCRAEKYDMDLKLRRIYYDCGLDNWSIIFYSRIDI